MIAQEVTSWNIAMEMLKAGLRPPVVHAATGLSRNRLRNMFFVLHGKPAVQGRVSKHAYNGLKTKNQVLEGTAFFQIYHRLGGDQIFHNAIAPGLFMSAYRVYQTAFPSCCIDIAHAWTIVQDLRENFLQLRRCRACDREYLFDPRSDLMSRCPLCAG